MGEGVKLGGCDVGEGLHEVGGEALVDAGGHHLAVALGDFEGAVDAADEVAHHIVAHAVQFGLGDGLLAQTLDFAVDLGDGVGGGSRGDIGGDVEGDAVAEYLGLAVDAVGVAFVLAQVAHEAGAEIAAKEGVEDHEAGVVSAVPREGEQTAYADSGLHGSGQGRVGHLGFLMGGRVGNDCGGWGSGGLRRKVSVGQA